MKEQPIFELRTISTKEEIDSLAAMLNRELPPTRGIFFMGEIEGGDTVVLKNDVRFPGSVEVESLTKYNQIHGLLSKSTQYFTNPSFDSDGHGVVAELVKPIGNIKKVHIYIEDKVRKAA